MNCDNGKWFNEYEIIDKITARNSHLTWAKTLPINVTNAVSFIVGVGKNEI